MDIEKLRTRHPNADSPWARSEAIECYERERAEAADEIERLRAVLKDCVFALDGLNDRDFDVGGQSHIAALERGLRVLNEQIGQKEGNGK